MTDSNVQQVRESSLKLSTVATSTRQTPKTDFGSVMRAGLLRAGGVAQDGLNVAAPFVPGGAIVSAALAGANTAAANTLGGGVGGAVGGGYGVTTSAFQGSPVGTGGTGNAYSLPTRRPGLDTPLGQPASNFQNGFGGPVAGAGADPTDAFNQMMAATREMSEFQASFNLQYLQLQEKIQMDTRQFTLISNIMKTKHDAAKNALGNVR
jgi:hypothetical protein